MLLFLCCQPNPGMQVLLPMRGEKAAEILNNIDPGWLLQKSILNSNSEVVGWRHTNLSNAWETAYKGKEKREKMKVVVMSLINTYVLLCHLLVRWPWARNLPSLSLCFTSVLHPEVGIICTCRITVRSQSDGVHEVPSVMPGTQQTFRKFYLPSNVLPLSTSPCLEKNLKIPWRSGVVLLHSDNSQYYIYSVLENVQSLEIMCHTYLSFLPSYTC